MRIAAAMSGGVDSAVGAFLLHAQGHEVIGLSMQLLDHSDSGSESAGRCCSGEDLLDAKRAAWKIGIPHYILDFEDIFERAVKEPFSSSYLGGETPTPCVECNTRVKFAPLLDRARALGCDRLATGHYARIVAGQDGRPRIARARDASKDQSYFLYELDPAVLEQVLFPLGEMTKEQSRAVAREAGLGVAEKPESMDICFVPAGKRYDDVVDRESPAPAAERSGEFVDRNGKSIGSHDGYHRYTVGQRRGIGTGFGERRYVIEIRPKDRSVVLGAAEDLLTEETNLCRVRWFGPSGPTRCRIRMRNRGIEEPATFEPRNDGSAIVRFDQPVRRTAPGQALVAYEGDVVLGGGRVTA